MQNQLTSIDLTGLSNLLTFDAIFNMFQTLDFSVLPALTQILLGYNPQLTSINLSGLTHLTRLGCNDTQIVTIDVRAMHELSVFGFGNNNALTSVYMKNGVQQTMTEMLYNNPNLQYICADPYEVNDLYSQLVLTGNSTCIVDSSCEFFPGSGLYSLSGNARFDSDLNGCSDGDMIVPELKIELSGAASQTLISNYTGHYNYGVLAGSYTMTPIIENTSYFNVSPSSVNINFPEDANPHFQDFCVTANGTHPDLEITTLPLSSARPGFDASYWIVFTNKGTTTQSGTLNFTFNDSVADFIYANPATTSQSGNTLNWNFDSLNPFETRRILVELNLNSTLETPPLHSGDQLTFSSDIGSIATDETPSDNSFLLHQTVVNALDPNDKTCLEGNVVAPEMVGEYVHYRIRFENTGNANAQNVLVKDIINTDKFDVSTLIPLSASHTYYTRISGNQVEFIFENINLPFTAGTNDGYVLFKIKTKPTLVAGDSFSNTASIYFDYNAPIVTNTATTNIAILAVKDFEFANYFTIYPNPANDVLNIHTKGTISVTSASIYNVLGQLVLAVPNSGVLSKIDVSELKSGNYFIKINSDKGSSNAKFIKR